ncbi:HNH endonuclease [Salmonirosea aquatica]|uniref:HNH endonuclease n=1 Tax=Salmonirosea aquatica TaxID=2654236 RepID=A0A7C9FP77_9BACT|nr:HNH endonuclease [Cytophagaceae bacterium SJW1-29]
MAQDLWTREQTILAFNLYCKIPYGTIHGRNPKLHELAKILGRSPGAVGRKMQNLASFDPYHKARGVKGLSNASKLDEKIWNEFNGNWNDLVYESELLLAKKQDIPIEQKFKINEDRLASKTGETRLQLVKMRVNQSFFRSVVLGMYNTRCAVSGINLPDMLRASHIVPWSKNKQERINPENGICLSALYDAAFDKGYIGIDTDYRIIIANKLKKYSKEAYYQEQFGKLEGRSLYLPDKFLPRQSFLEFHLNEIFNK